MVVKQKDKDDNDTNDVDADIAFNNRVKQLVYPRQRPDPESIQQHINKLEEKKKEELNKLRFLQNLTETDIRRLNKRTRQWLVETVPKHRGIVDKIDAEEGGG